MRKRQTKRICLGKPNPKQIQFFRSKHRVTCYGGARGGGKSWAIQMLAVRLALDYKGLSIAIVRRTLTDAKANHLAPLMHMAKNVLPEGIMGWRAIESRFQFYNGSSITFCYFGTDSDAVKWQGMAFDAIFVDEATQFLEDWFRVMMMCNRTSVTYKDDRIFKPRMYLTCNPGGVGHDWVKRLFIQRDYNDNENPDDFTFIPATLDDNAYLNEHSPEYRQALESLPEAQKRAMLYGDWDVFEGLFFGDFRKDVHTDTVKIQPDWNKYACFDYGFDMFAAYLVAVDYDGRLYVYRELCEGKDLGEGHDGLIVSDAAAMLTADPDYKSCLATFAPPDMWNRRQDTGRSAAEIFAEHGVFCTKVSNDRIAGWNDLHESLDIRPDGKPGLIIDRGCVNLISAMQLVLRDEKKVDDMAKEPHKWTHFPDALRYLVSGRPAAPVRTATDTDTDIAAWDDFNNYDGGYDDFDW